MGRSNWTIFFLAHTCCSMMGCFHYVFNSDDPLFLLLGPGNGNYWSDQGTWGPWPEGAWLQHLHKTIPVFSSRGTTWGFYLYLYSKLFFHYSFPHSAPTSSQWPARVACASSRSPMSLHSHFDYPGSFPHHLLPRLHSLLVVALPTSFSPSHRLQSGAFSQRTTLTPDCSETFTAPHWLGE